jgi:hypothetical protein
LLEDNPDKFKKLIGREAIFKCTLAIADEQGGVYIAVGEVKGTIVARNLNSLNGFGFDPFFQPNNSNKTLAEYKPDELNARAIAFDNLVNGRVRKIFVPQAESWKGRWQHDSFFNPSREKVKALKEVYSPMQANL